MRYEVKNVCAKYVDFEIKDNKMHNLQFLGGCNGNGRAISKLLEGMEVNNIIKILDGNKCGDRATSCTNELVKVLKGVVNG